LEEDEGGSSECRNALTSNCFLCSTHVSGLTTAAAVSYNICHCHHADHQSLAYVLSETVVWPSNYSLPLPHALPVTFSVALTALYSLLLVSHSVLLTHCSHSLPSLFALGLQATSAILNNMGTAILASCSIHGHSLIASTTDVSLSHSHSSHIWATPSLAGLVCIQC